MTLFDKPLSRPVSSCRRCAKPLSASGAVDGYCKDCHDVVTNLQRAITELKKKVLTTSDPFEKNRLLNDIKKQEQRRDKA